MPNDMTKDGKLTPNDLLVYVTIKSFYNHKTTLCFPGLRAISKKCGFSIPTIRNSIEALEEEQWISVSRNKRRGSKQFYTFRKSAKFEMFSPEFLDNEVIPAKEKAYLTALQQYMYKDIEGLGKVSYSEEELSNIINLSETIIQKYDKSLELKGLLSVVDSNKMENGIMINNRFYHLDELGQSIIFALQTHDAKIDNNSKEIKDLQYLIKKLLKDKNKTTENGEIILP